MLCCPARRMVAASVRMCAESSEGQPISHGTRKRQVCQAAFFSKLWSTFLCRLSDHRQITALLVRNVGVVSEDLPSLAAWNHLLSRGTLPCA